MSHSRHRQTKALDPAAIVLGRLFDDYLDQETGLRGYVITTDSTFLAPYTAGSTRMALNGPLLRRDVASIPQAPTQLDAVFSAYQTWLTAYAEPTLAEARAGNLAAARDPQNETHGKTMFDAVRSKVQMLNATISRAIAANQRETDDRETQLWLLLGASLVVLLAATVGALVLVRRLVVSPLQALRERVRAVVTHGFDQPVTGAGPAEIIDMANDVEAMRSRLVEEIDMSRRSAEALLQEGPAVTALRRALYPRLAPLPGMQIMGRLVPAAGLLAGDWFDVLALDGGEVGLVIGDVSGHGADAGVYALELKHLIANTLRTGLSPGEVLAVTARQMTAPAEVFATVVVAVVDPVTDALTYANAGHPDGLLLTALPSSALQRPGEWPLSLPPTGPLLSEIVAGSSWGSVTHPLAPGDTIVFITDGIVEARDAAGAEFGAARLDALCDQLAEADVDSLAEGIVAAVATFSGSRQPDDRTVLVCRRTPVSSSADEHERQPDDDGVVDASS